MSLLMEALRKAERAKQEQTIPSIGQSFQPGDSAATPNLLAGQKSWPSLLSLDGAEGRVAATDNTLDFPSAPATQEKFSGIPELDPLPSEAQGTKPLLPEQRTSVLELALDVDDSAADSNRGRSEFPAGKPLARSEALASPLPRAAPDIPSQVLSRSPPETSAKPGVSIPPQTRLEAHQKAVSQDDRKIAAAQQKARTIFSAKPPAPSRTLLLTGIVAAALLGPVGFGIYYWQTISSGMTDLPISVPAPAIAVDAAAPQQQAATDAPVQTPINDPEPVVAAVRISPPATPLAEDSPRPVRTARAEARGESRGESRGSAHSEPDSFKENPAVQIRQSTASSQVNPVLAKAYQSFLSGDTGTAQQLYRAVLQKEPNNRDALLGMAAVALNQQQTSQAAAYYGKLLDLDPADPDALAALIGLQGQGDPTQSESRLKKLLTQNPQADAAHFALGNLYTRQSRWAEAQQSYFRAYSSAPGNADYAFNLAVSLDQLNQGKLALDYYQRALALPGPANFDKSSAQTRIKELLQPAGN